MLIHFFLPFAAHIYYKSLTKKFIESKCDYAQPYIVAMWAIQIDTDGSAYRT